ncbi:Putative inorganic phosphate cotransporter [Araneus ventricosus]|uniref:Inorganic phosphate cotransporter n=1 Tax=Araneus ventricosus TaxID=182803 RepID=A0A4Y2FVQ7_ARAVE|nr:Putative inorganic phosphate cotransporter [Araneus ventricosus]
MINADVDSIELQKKGCYLPARYVLSFLLIWAKCLEYAQRVCLSVTIVAMINHTALDAGTNDSTYDDDTCDAIQGINATTPEEEGDFLWSPSTQGMILAAYFYGYVCTQVVGGRFAEVFGGKWVLGLSILIASFLTLGTPIAADIGVAAMVVVRVMMGMIHGVCMPTAFALFGHWAPVEEKSTLIALCVVGDNIGTILTMPLTGYLCEYGFAGGWPSVYYILGIVGFVWFFFWFFLAYNRPSDHPRISRIEIDYIQKGQIQFAEEQKLPVPWKKVLTSMPVWTVAVVSFCSTWGFITLLTKLPTYLEVVLHVPIQKNGLVNSLVYASICITLFVSSYLSDYLRSNKHMNSTKVRKGFEFIALMGPALCTGLIPVARCDRVSVIALLTLAMAFLGFAGGGHVSIVADMAPHHSASIFGFVNSVGCVAGIISPMAAGFLLDNAHASVEQWSIVYYISSGFYLLGAIIFTIWGSAEKQSWAQSPYSDKLLSVPYLQSEKLPSIANSDSEKRYGSIP